MRKVRRLALISILGPILFLFGCSESSGPGDVQDFVRGPLTLENAWPDDDGRSWIFGAGQSFRDGVDPGTPPSIPIPIFATQEEVPRMPSLDAFEATLAEYDLSDPGVDYTAYGLTFDGRGTTDSGAEGKKLVPIQFTEPPVYKEPGDPFLDAFLHHRLDLSASFPNAQKLSLAYRPMLVRDGIWLRTDETIAFYNDLDTEARFQLLDADLTPGHEWSVELLPSLEKGPKLHARILGPVRQKIPIVGRPPTTLRVLYTVDMGILSQRDEQLNTIGYSRVAAFGIVDYLQGVGPSHYHEFHFAYLDKAQDGSPVILEPGSQLWGWLRDWEKP